MDGKENLAKQKTGATRECRIAPEFYKKVAYFLFQPIIKIAFDVAHQMSAVVTTDIVGVVGVD